ncbi:hypothetical protein EDD86DRAFT_197705 [Gorgonomyces haynaldii]|nr:hypothetical protein EDD86DRAFT_197705 [Gorgonomyces haynaldii]
MNTVDDAFMMASTAVTIWSFFAVNGTEQVFKRIPAACKLLLMQTPEELKQQILQTLAVIGQTPQGFDCICVDPVLQSLLKCCQQPHEKWMGIMIYLLELLSDHSPALDLSQFLIPVCQYALTDNVLKFRAFELAVKILCKESNKALEDNAKQLIPLLRQLVKQVLKSKLTGPHRDTLIMLCGMLFQRLGTDWIPITKTNHAEKRDQLTNGQLLVLMTHTACAEIRVILDDTKEDIVETPRTMTILPLCFAIVEGVVKLLVTDTEVTLNLDYQLLSSTRSAMAEAFMAVACFLVERHDMYIQNQRLSTIDNHMTMTSLRAYSQWVSEETEVPIEDLERLLPLVHTILSKPLSCLEIHPLHFLTGLLTLVTSEQTLLDCFILNGTQIPIILYLSDHMQTMDTELEIAIQSILLNVLVSKEAEIRMLGFESLIEPLAQRVLKTDDPLLSATSAVVFLLLYRSDYYCRLISQTQAQSSISKILDFVSVERDDEVEEIVYLIMTVIPECIQKCQLSQQSKQDYVTKLSKLQLQDEALHQLMSSLEI